MANVFWDLGSTFNFITIRFAKKCGFKGEEKELNVTTLGNVTKDMVEMSKLKLDQKQVISKSKFN